LRFVVEYEPAPDGVVRRTPKTCAVRVSVALPAWDTTAIEGVVIPPPWVSAQVYDTLGELLGHFPEIQLALVADDTRRAFASYKAECRGQVAEQLEAAVAATGLASPAPSSVGEAVWWRQWLDDYKAQHPADPGI
jgi:hypothetical protein